VSEIKWKEEWTIEILESNFSKIEKKFQEIRDGPKTILQETETWIEKFNDKMETLKTNVEDPNYIAFEMLEEKDTEHDIIR